MLRLDLVDGLEAAGLTVTEAGTAEDAMEFLESGAQVDILVTDIRLGGAMTGWDLAEAFRRGSPAGAVVYASANAALADREVAGSLFFTKPVPLRALVDSCLRLCRHGHGASER